MTLLAKKTLGTFAVLLLFSLNQVAAAEAGTSVNGISEDDIVQDDSPMSLNGIDTDRELRARGPPRIRPGFTFCEPLWTKTIQECSLSMMACDPQSVNLKWTGAGCNRRVGRRLVQAGDGGCQCQGYCGYTCRGPCDRDPQCFWSPTERVCKTSAGEIGLPIGPQCPNKATETPNTTPTAAPTVHPTAYPTTYPTAHPTEHPTGLPTMVPTPNPTSQPTSRPTESPSNAPTCAVNPACYDAKEFIHKYSNCKGLEFQSPQLCDDCATTFCDCQPVGCKKVHRNKCWGDGIDISGSSENKYFVCGY